jgi:voltage-gated potassium channel Kch
MRLQQKFVAERFGGNYAPLFFAMIALYVVAPVVEAEFWSGRAIQGAFFSVILLAVLGGTNSAPVRLGAALFAAAGFAAGSVADAWDIDALSHISTIGGIVLIVFAGAVVVMDVLSQSRPTINAVVGSICVYFMMSGFWAFVFMEMQIVDSGSFEFPAGEEITGADALYFSLVTQTTLGYGDISPLSPLARAFSGIEALLGQVFLVALVARLVGLHVAQSSQRLPQGRMGVTPRRSRARRRSTAVPAAARLKRLRRRLDDSGRRSTSAP